MKNDKAAIDSIFLSGSQKNPDEKAWYVKLSLAIRAFGRKVANTPSLSFGLFFMTFGLSTLFLHFMEFYLFPEDADVFIPLIVGIVSTVLGIPFVFSKKPIYHAVEENPVTDALFFDFLCLRRRHIPEDCGRIPQPVITLLGVTLAMIGSVLSPMYVFAGFVFIFLLWACFESPEAPFFLSLIFFPYFHLLDKPAVYLAVLLSLSLLSYVHKAVLGNRRFRFDRSDGLLLLFGICILLPGIFKGGVNSFLSSLLFVSMLFGCFLAKNLLINRRLADIAMGSVAVSSVPVGVIALVQFFAVPIENRFDSVRVCGTFQTPNIYAVYLLAVIFCITGLIAEKRTALFRFFFGLILLVNVTALILTFCRGAWLAVLFGAVACLIMYFVKKPAIPLVLLAVLPYGIFALPESVLVRFQNVLRFTDASISYNFSVWRSSLKLWLDNFFGGIGIGEKNFTEVFARYAQEGVSASHSYNLLLEVGCECGIFTLLAFLAVLFYRAYEMSKDKKLIVSSGVKKVCYFVHAAISAILIYGLFDYPFADMGMAYLFFLLFGVGGATLRISLSEDFNKKNYRNETYEDASASLNVYLSK